MLYSFYHSITQKMHSWLTAISAMKSHIEISINYMSTMNKKWQCWHFSSLLYELIELKVIICLSFAITNNKHKNKVNSEPEL